jgi:iron-sulfur cluster assembly protein
MQQNDMQGYGLRVAVSPGGCSGFSYVLDLVEEQEEDDQIFEQDGLRILCDTKSLSYVEGIEIDYESTMMSGNFKFSNPNAKKSCGCGTSFTC